MGSEQWLVASKIFIQDTLPRTAAFIVGGPAGIQKTWPVSGNPQLLVTCVTVSALAPGAYSVHAIGEAHCPLVSRLGRLEEGHGACAGCLSQHANISQN